MHATDAGQVLESLEKINVHDTGAHRAGALPHFSLPVKWVLEVDRLRAENHDLKLPVEVLNLRHSSITTVTPPLFSCYLCAILFPICDLFGLDQG
jgi:hypothetical protein